MLIWFILIFITVVVILLLVRALSKDIVLSKHYNKNSDQSDINFYKDQLHAIDQEEAEGQISTANANQARLELARRILSREKQISHKKTPQNHFIRSVIYIGILCIMMGSWGIYYFIGNPNVRSQPFEALMMREDVKLNLSEKIVKTESLLARNPNQSNLLDSLGELYLQIGRFADAATVFDRSLSVNGKSSQRFLNYAIALIALENGVVSQDAENALQKASQLEPQNPQPQIFLARGLIQNGKIQQAIKLLENFVSGHGKGQPWAQDMQSVIDQLKIGSVQEQVKPSAQQYNFINDNIVKLEEHVHNNPQDVQGWFMLINAYFILEKPQKMRDTYNDALKLLTVENIKKINSILNKKGFSLLSNKEVP